MNCCKETTLELGRRLYELSDIGVPGYKCDAELMKPSKTVPTNVNSVRPADIKVVMALGDSLTRGIVENSHWV
ncbi:hypothetical protein ANCDUO_01218 [Ancylostoma duodenale]|uniref:Uncharacterized protein n=1 Tax=Ancylostoma duodenale TaxID=51022 RepID=A0A0C2DEQ8_9BILA|nr:hypothetical protein ANCDUO_01218 [Ancylostoma duodenale]